jgi:hypothetical protein
MSFRSGIPEARIFEDGVGTCYKQEGAEFLSGDDVVLNRVLDQLGGALGA